jgi:hypothetical protein
VINSCSAAAAEYQEDKTVEDSQYQGKLFTRPSASTFLSTIAVSSTLYRENSAFPGRVNTLRCNRGEERQRFENMNLFSVLQQEIPPLFLMYALNTVALAVRAVVFSALHRTLSKVLNTRFSAKAQAKA